MNDSTVYLVVVEKVGLFGAYLDEGVAHRQAEAIGAVVATLPIVADYRTRNADLRGSDSRESTTEGGRMVEDRVEYVPQGDDFLIRIDGEDYGLIEQTKADDYLAEPAKRGQDELVAAIKKEVWVRKFGDPQQES